MKHEGLTPKEIRQRTDEELRRLAAQLQQDLLDYRFQVVTSQQQDTSVLKQARRDLARVKTILRARELGKEPSVGSETDED